MTKNTFMTSIHTTMGHHTISFTDTTVRALSTIPEIQKTVVVLRNAVSVMDKNTPIAKLNIFSLSWNLFHMLYTDPRPYGSDCACAAAIQLFMFVSSHVALHCMFLLLWICMQSFCSFLSFQNVEKWQILWYCSIIYTLHSRFPFDFYVLQYVSFHIAHIQQADSGLNLDSNAV